MITFNYLKKNCLLKMKNYQIISSGYKTLVEMQKESCNKYTDKPLFSTDNKKWMSYKDWNNNIGYLRSVLQNYLVKPGDRVSIISNNKIEWAVSAYATYSCGGVFVPMYQNQLEKDWEYILNDSLSRVLICTDKKVFNRCKKYLYSIKSLQQIIFLNDNYFDLYQLVKYCEIPHLSFHFIDDKIIYPDENDLATLIYTSGTTGNPKGVKITHKNLVSNIKSVQNSFKDFSKICNENDKSISFLPWAHCYGQTCELHGLISAGASIYISKGVEYLAEELEIVKPTLLFSVPALFNKMYDSINKKMNENKVSSIMFKDSFQVSERIRNEDFGPIDLLKYNLYNKLFLDKIKQKLGGNLKLAFVGGAATPVEVIKFFENINLPIIEGYGLSETSPMISLGCLEYPDRKIGSVGKILPGVDVKIISKENKQLDINHVGEIFVSSDSVTIGYNNNKEENNKSFEIIDGKKYFKTGDMGYLDEENRLYIKGRLKEQYKLENGKFVVPTLVEDIIIMIPNVKQVMVYGENKPYNIALIVPNYENIDISIRNDKDLLSQMYLEEINFISKKKNMKSYEVPKGVIILDEDFTLIDGLLTPKMSLKRNKIYEKYKDLINDYYTI